MSDIEERIKILKRRPGMCIGKQDVTVEELFIYIMGFCNGKQVSDSMTMLDESFYRCFTYYVYDWMEKNNRLNHKELKFSWYKFFEIVKEEERVSLFYSLCEKFFSEYHSGKLKERYYIHNKDV